MRYLSVCSGIEAATVAWHPLGWKPVGFSEIESFPSTLLAHHYPGVPNYGDMIRHEEWPIEKGSIDVLVGGTPCQSFSVAGLRQGLVDPRGNLALIYLRLLDRLRPKWFVWENVPGVLSSRQGRDFGSFLGGVAKLGYGFAYRVLDARYWGVAQRRRRVFVVGHLADWRRAASVLFEHESIDRNFEAVRETKAQTTAEAPFVIDRAAFNQGVNAQYQPRAEQSEIMSALVAKGPHAVATAPTYRVRRLTPTECERLQGFPDGYTDIIMPRKKGDAKPASDGSRYAALGNSMAVPVMRWIGERISLVEYQVAVG